MKTLSLKAKTDIDNRAKIKRASLIQQNWTKVKQTIVYVINTNVLWIRNSIVHSELMTSHALRGLAGNRRTDAAYVQQRAADAMGAILKV